MTWFAHECWYCGHTSRDVVLLISSIEYHERHGLSPYQCNDRKACEARHVSPAAAVVSTEPEP